MDSNLSATMPHNLLLPNFLGDCWDRNKNMEEKSEISAVWSSAALELVMDEFIPSTGQQN